MILDRQDHTNNYASLGARFKKAFDHLIKTDFTQLENGKHIIDGDDVFVIVMEYETKEPDDCIMENHRKYADIQYMVAGEEMIGIATYNNQVPTMPYDETKEAAFYEKNYTSMIRLQEKHFAVFFPQDLHMPCIKAGKAGSVKKAVYKIRV